MALNFPDNPGIGTVFTDATSGFSWQWTGAVWKSYRPSAVENVQTLDDISGSFDNSTLSFALTVNGVAQSPRATNLLQISVGGVIQNPNTDYTISGSNIVFTTAPAAGLDFFGIIRGTAIAIDYANDGNVQNKQNYTATAGQTEFTFSAGYTSGYLNIYRNGVKLRSTDFTETSSTIFTLTTPAQENDEIEAIGYVVASIVTTQGEFQNLNISGIGTIANAIVTNLNATGIITGGSFSGDGSGLTGVASTDNIITSTPAKFLNDVTITGITTISNVIVGGATTELIVEGDARVTGILTIGTSSITLDGANNTVNVGTGVTLDGTAGTIKATTFVGDGSQLTGAGVGTETSVNTTGIITASAFYGDGNNLTFAPKIISYNPPALSTGVGVGTNITFTFDQNIYFSGTGTIEIRETTSGGTIATSFPITSGSAATGLSIVDTQLIVNPTADLSTDTIYYVILPSAGIANTNGTYYGGSNNYNFRTIPPSFSAEGGDDVYTLADPASPTGYYRYHIFTSSGILTTTNASQNSDDFSLMMLAGGGGGGTIQSPTSAAGGGGGAGGYISHTGPTLALATGTYTVTIGAGGGPIAPTTYYSNPGNDTTITPPTSPTTYVLRTYGGGAGGARPAPTDFDGIGRPGGSGGGGSLNFPSVTSRAGGTGIPGQGYDGASSITIYPVQPAENGVSGGGGGGAGGTGEPNTYTNRFYGPTYEHAFGGAGGPGTPNTAFKISNLSGYVSTIPADSLSEIGPTGLYGGGGGGSAYPGAFSWGGAGGAGGGGNGKGAYSTLPAPWQAQIPAPIVTQKYTNVPDSEPLRHGYASTGGGGGGSNGTTPRGSGGSGVVMIRYSTTAPV